MKHCIQSLFYNIEQTARICRAGIEIYLEEHIQSRLSFDEFIILDTVYCYPEVCQRDLAKLILKGASHTSKFLSTLEDKGLIERPVDTKGNRIVKKIIITKQGEQLYEEAYKVVLDYAKKIENIIGKTETLNCITFLDKIKKSVEESCSVVFE